MPPIKKPRPQCAKEGCAVPVPRPHNRFCSPACAGKTPLKRVECTLDGCHMLTAPGGKYCCKEHAGLGSGKLPKQNRMKGTCTVEGCNGPVKKGKQMFCEAHTRRVASKKRVTAAQSSNEPSSRKPFLFRNSYFGKIPRTRDGEKIEAKRQNLHTTDYQVAVARLKRLTKENPDEVTVSQAELFNESGDRLCEAEKSRIKTWEERLSLLEYYAYPLIGYMPIDQIEPHHVYRVLCLAGGLPHSKPIAGESSNYVVVKPLSRGTVKKLRTTMKSVFTGLVNEGLLKVSPICALPKGLYVDGRPRVILRDEECLAFFEAEDIAMRLRMMARVSRTFGGMRVSDLLAWDWTHVNLDDWETAKIPRPKSQNIRAANGEAPKTIVQLVTVTLPKDLVPRLKSWWRKQGSPVQGGVFDDNQDETKNGRGTDTNIAETMRAALWTIGLRRHEVHEDTDETKRADFHSFRRAYCTGLAVAGVTEQQAMALAGHADGRTHAGYLAQAQVSVLQTPEASLPQAEPQTLPAGSDFIELEDSSTGSVSLELDMG